MPLTGDVTPFNKVVSTPPLWGDIFNDRGGYSVNAKGGRCANDRGDHTASNRGCHSATVRRSHINIKEEEWIQNADKVLLW